MKHLQLFFESIGRQTFGVCLSCALLSCLTGCVAKGHNGHSGSNGETPSLSDAFEGKFFIGAAINLAQIYERDTASVNIIKKHFNAIVPENCMKSMFLQPAEGKFFFDDADRFVAFGERYGKFVTGHTLIWHSQTPRWFFVDSAGQDVSREVMIERMRSHITATVSRYRGRIRGWDVVNEAVEDDGSLRNSKFLQIIGEDYLPLAFEFAHAADPDAQLYYNDYSMAIPAKRDGVVRLVKSLQEAGVRIDGVGMQGHLNMDFPGVEEFEKSLLAFAGLGVKIMITELDLSVLPSPRQSAGAEVSQTFEYQQSLNPYADGLLAAVEKQWNERMSAFFDLFLKHRDKITRVTLWGVSDGDSWKNDWPVPGRTDYPLLFDRKYKLKELTIDN